MPEVSEILPFAYPGLTNEQLQCFSDAASGNPGHVAEIIFLLERKPHWFENKDFASPLNHQWKENTSKEKLDLVSLERARFDAVEEALKELLGSASLQEDRFLRAFTRDVTAKLGLELLEAEDPLLPAEIPHALAESLDASSREFRSVNMRKAADDYLREVKAEEEIAQAIATSTQEWMASGKFAELSMDLQLRLLGSAASHAEKAGARNLEVLFLATALEQIHESGILLYSPPWIASWE